MSRGLRATLLSTALFWRGCASDPCPMSSADSPPAPAPEQRLYRLPFEPGRRCIVGQGSFGVFGLGSHTCQYAIDFVMEIDTRILAARGGRVVAVREDCENVNCPFAPETCCGNQITIEHDDGTRAYYVHLVQFGACVEVGAEVQQGDVIGRSGNTGYSIGPHLHFGVFAPGGEAGGGRLGPSADRSVEVHFADVPGDGVPRLLQYVTSENSVGRDWCR